MWCLGLSRLKLLPRVKLSLAPLGRLLQLSVDVASQALQAGANSESDVLPGHVTPHGSGDGQHRLSEHSVLIARAARSSFSLREDLAVNFAPLGIFLCRQKHLTFHPPLVTPAANSFSPTVQLRKLQLSLELSLQTLTCLVCYLMNSLLVVCYGHAHYITL